MICHFIVTNYDSMLHPTFTDQNTFLIRCNELNLIPTCKLLCSLSSPGNYKKMLRGFCDFRLNYCIDTVIDVISDGIQNFKNRFSFELHLLLTGFLIFITKVKCLQQKARTGSLIVPAFQERVRTNPCEPPESHYWI